MGLGPTPQQCLRQLYVKFQYLPPPTTHTPLDCALVLFTKAPDIRLDSKSVVESKSLLGPLGVDIHCTFVSPKGAGAVYILLQVGGILDWEFGFLNQQGKWVTEYHRVYFSLPLMYKLDMPMMALMAVTPWKIKLPSYLIRIANAVRKLDEIQTVIEKIAKFSINRCGAGLDDLLKSLQNYEDELNRLLRSIDTGENSPHYARMQKSLNPYPDHTGRFLGSRIA